MVERYDINTDNLTELTQEWFDDNQLSFKIASKKNALIKYIILCNVEEELNNLLNARNKT